MNPCLRHKIRLVYLTLSLLVAGYLSFAQISADEILALPAEQQPGALDYYALGDKRMDESFVTAYFQKLESDFKVKGNLFLARQAWLTHVHYMAIFRFYYDPEGIRFLDEKIKEARQRGWAAAEAECIVLKGLLYYTQQRYGSGFEYMQKGHVMLRDIGFEQCPRMIYLLEEMAKAYYEFGDYAGAIPLLREAIELPQVLKGAGEKRKTMNTLALCFRELDQYDSAVHYYTLAHEESIAVRDTFWAALTNGNKGHIYYLQGKYDLAIPLIEEDFNTSVRFNDLSSAVNAALSLSTMHLKRGEVEKAGDYLDFSIRNQGSFLPLYLPHFYRDMATISRLKGDNENAFRYLDSFLLHKDLVAKTNDAKIINQARLKVEVEQHAHEIQMLEQARTRQVLLRNGLLAILLLSGIIGILLVRQQRMRRNEEIQLAIVRRKAAEEQLDLAKKQLLVFTNALKEKNELLESFKKEIEDIRQSGEQRLIDRMEHINQLVHSTILTEEEWKEFRFLFDKVHPGFFIRLKEQFNDLTPAETRLLALTKLDLAPKEMAAMLGISYDAIKKSRQRLRRKIHLPEEGSLDELVGMI